MKLLQRQKEMNMEKLELKLGNLDIMCVLNSPKYNQKVSHHFGFHQKMVTGNIIIKFKL